MAITAGGATGPVEQLTSEHVASAGTVTGRTGREYLRVSYDRSGRERSQDEQQADNRRACAERGITLLAAYREAGSASASRYARKGRDDFERLLADLDAGRFAAEVLVLWESSRGSRRVAEWVTLIELCERQHVSIFVTTHGRVYDPANARDRRSLLEDAVDSEYESSRVSVRAARAHAANAAAGRPGGVTPYGYLRHYDQRTRQLVAQEPDPATAPVVRELFARLRAGHSLRGIAKEFADRGIVTAGTGRPFTPEHLRTMATTAAYAGIRLHKPVTARPASGGGRTVLGAPGVTATPGTWPGLVSVEEFLAVQAILNDPKRRTSKPGKAKHLLSLIARCAVCGGPLTVTLRRPEAGPEYQCNTGGHVRCSKTELDEYAEAAMLAYLARADIHQNLTAGDEAAGAELARVRENLATARHELATLRAEVGAGRLSVGSLVAAEPGILTRITALEAEETRLSTPSVLRGLITPGEGVATRWREAPISARRDIARILLTADVLGELRVTRRPPGWPVTRHMPAGDRVQWYRGNPADQLTRSGHA